MLKKVKDGADWRDISPHLFGGGSYGNGAAMRVAPVGAFFYDDPKRAAHEAQLSAVVTHAHLEGQAGAIAVAVAASFAANKPCPSGNEFLKAVVLHIPNSITKTRIQQATQIAPDELPKAIQQLGTGSEVSAQDTVPFCLWSAAHHLSGFEDALWFTAKGMGDCDTTCAIVGGIVALSSPEIPALWIERREPLNRRVRLTARKRPLRASRSRQLTRPVRPEQQKTSKGVGVEDMKWRHAKNIFAMGICVALCGTSLSAQTSKSLEPSNPLRNRYPQFEDYPALEAFRGQPAPVDLSSHPNARFFRTRLREGAKRGVNFAGNYALVRWGCGNECQQALVIDLRTGIVYGLAEPSAKRPIESSRGMEFEPTSRLIIADPPCPKDYNPCVSWARSAEPVRYYLMEKNGLRLIHKIPCKLEDERQRCGD